MLTTDKVANKLINEKSPYLLQHAYNPVDWYPWGNEAFERAKLEDKPIFLSIGYSTCHWCHVMEKESFEDDEVAEVLNKNFISIKVDREERPDIDSIYMAVCQAVTGSGGWPLTIIMTPDKNPFFAGTYYPKKTKGSYFGLMDLLPKINKLWQEDKKTLIEAGSSLVNSLKVQAKMLKKEELHESVIKDAYYIFLKTFDKEYGGFNFSPKFPSPHNLSFLLMYYSAYEEKEALNMVKKTLDSMYMGGIFDHIGFGFSRYSVDNKWLVPHFEKMLYDNALLAYTYAEAYVATGKPLYKSVADKIFTYVLRDMTSPLGGFYSAEDADSEGVEGKFYLWNKEEIEAIISHEKSKIFCDFYNITPGGNFEHKNIPNLIGKDFEKLQEHNNKILLESSIEELFNLREKRIHPHKDDKILTSWNGLMIAALSYSGKVFKSDLYIKAAKAALNFIFNNLQDKNGELLSRYREGETSSFGFLDDYAFLIWGLIETYEATYEIDYLEKALNLNNTMFHLFWDEENGGLFLSGRGGEELVLKSKDPYDGALPSGNSVAAANNLRLFRITGDTSLEERAENIFKAFSSTINKVPQGYSKMISAFLYSKVPGRQIVISGVRGDKNTEEMLSIINKKYNPFTTVIFNDNSNKIHELIPYTKDELMINNKATAYICKNFTCRAPITDLEEFNYYANRKE